MKIDPMSDKAFCLWLQSWSAKDRFDYADIHGCAIYQYLEAAGLKPAAVGGWDWTDRKGITRPIPPSWLGAVSTPHRTYRAAAQYLTTGKNRRRGGKQ